MKKILCLLAIIVIAPTSVYADTFLGLYVGAGFWNQENTGRVQFLGSDIDLQDEFGLDSNTNGTFYLALEHPVPMLPNIKFQYSKVSTTGSRQLSEAITFDNTTYNVNDTIKSRFVLDNSDLIVYYEVLDNWVNLDLGLDIKYFDGEVAIESTTTNDSGKHDFSAPLPMLYAKVQFDIPTTGFYLGGEGSGIKVGSSQVVDFKLLAGYESGIGLGCELGWRKLAIDSDDVDDMVVDISVEGFFANVTYHF